MASGNSAEAAVASWPRPVLAFWRSALRPYEPAMLIVLVYFLAAQILAASRGDTLSVGIVGYAQQLGLIFPILICIWLVAQFVRMAVVERPERPISAFGQLLKRLVLHPQRWANALFFLSTIMLLSTAFSYFKAQIPALMPFSWDIAFDRADVLLHGGKRPWELLQPVLGHPLASMLVNVAYNGWFFAMIGVWLLLAFTLHEKAPRQQFLLAFIMTWIVGGTVLAIVFSSAGPCYFGKIVAGADPYRALLDYLVSANAGSHTIWALDTQAMLWQGYLSNGEELAGISAMPSMHVATATLFIPLALRMAPRLAWLAVVFFLMILIGSVHLAWHYAVDGYLGASIALGCWWISGKLVGHHDKAACEPA